MIKNAEKVRVNLAQGRPIALVLVVRFASYRFVPTSLSTDTSPTIRSQIRRTVESWTPLSLCITQGGGYTMSNLRAYYQSKQTQWIVQAGG